jgi:hypothetical protein
MIKVLTGLPDGVVGFETEGKVHAEDYRDVLIPEVEKAAAAAPLRAVVVIPTWDGMSGGALWEDMKLGLNTVRDLRRLALVTDIEWMGHALSLFGWLTPGEMKRFALAARDAAATWAAGD